ncbi:hypothetical protein IX51_01045 [uncultured archaeon]|nr:hypothetical protein IX51_01045 [uncultured archaeon]
MIMDEEMLFDFMSQYKVIGEIAFGGTGTREEDILVGYIYGVLSSNPGSTLEKAEVDYEMFSFGGYKYIVWMDEIDHEDEDDEAEEPLEPVEENPLVRIEQVRGSIDDFTDEDLEDFMENVDDDLFPVAVEGPLSSDEVKEKFGDEF